MGLVIRASIDAYDFHSLPPQLGLSNLAPSHPVVWAGRNAPLDHKSESARVRTLPETSTPAAWFSPERPSYKWWVTLALMLGILTQGLNFGTVNIALPSMMTSLQAEIDT